MKKSKRNLESSIEKLENEMRLYHDLDDLIKSYKESAGLSEKDILSVIERIKYQIYLDAISSQAGIKDKLDRFTKKWNLFNKEEKVPDKPKPIDQEPPAEAKEIPLGEPPPEDPDKEIVLKKKKRFQLRSNKKSSDKLFSKMKRKLKVSRCENCGYFYVHDEEKGIYQCTFFEFSSKVGKKDVCENWISNKKFQQPFF